MRKARVITGDKRSTTCFQETLQTTDALKTNVFTIDSKTITTVGNTCRESAAKIKTTQSYKFPVLFPSREQTDRLHNNGAFSFSQRCTGTFSSRHDNHA